MYLVTTCKFDVREKQMLLCPVTLKCGGTEFKKDFLLDTGAGICHMTYPLWVTLGLNNICWNDNPKLFKLMKQDSPSDMQSMFNYLQ